MQNSKLKNLYRRGIYELSGSFLTESTNVDLTVMKKTVKSRLMGGAASRFLPFAPSFVRHAFDF